MYKAKSSFSSAVVVAQQDDQKLKVRIITIQAVSSPNNMRFDLNMNNCP
ncbi:hypothetical protein DGWBC_0189 [Dehalogenimonas sp. WBC-2]|nr:hypothetical protein DGWBC_0189 [Dehalogenimonas sp. WBC-2]